MMEDFVAYKGLFIERGILLATSNNGEIDLSSPSGVLTASIKTAVSEHEVAMMRIRQCRAARQRAEQGRPKWRKAFGYLPDTRPKEKDDGTRKLDKRVQRRVKAAYSAVDHPGRARRSPKSPSKWNKAASTASPASRGRPRPSACSCAPRATPVCGHTTARSSWTRTASRSRAPGPPGGRGPVACGADGDQRPGRKPGPKSVRLHLLTGVLRCGRARTRAATRRLAGHWVMQARDGPLGRTRSPTPASLAGAFHPRRACGRRW